MFIKLVCLCSVAACVIAAPSPTGVVPLEKQQPTVIPIVSQSEELESNGTYKFSYETANGIKREETSYDKVLPKVEGRSAASGDDSDSGSGSDESNEIHVQQGSYSYTAPDGTVITVRYIADENGFRAFGEHIPTVPTLTQQVSANSNAKSGKALKADSEDSESAPVPVAAKRPEAPAVVASSPVKPKNEDALTSNAPATEASSTQEPADKSSETEPTTASLLESSTTEAASTLASELSTSTSEEPSSEGTSPSASEPTSEVTEEPTTEAGSTVAVKESATKGASTPEESATSETSTSAQSSSEVSTTESASPTTSAA